MVTKHVIPVALISVYNLEPPKEVSVSASQNPSNKNNLSKTGQDFIKRNIEVEK